MKSLLTILFLLSTLVAAAQQQPKLMLPIGHTFAVNSAVFSPDGQRIVTASLDKTAKIWDAKTGALLASLEGHSSWVNSAVFSPDGQRIVTLAFMMDSTAKIWDAKTGALLANLKHSKHVDLAVFSPNGQRIVTASWDRTTKLWDAKTGALLASLEGHLYGVSSAVFSPDGRKIVTSSSDNTAKIWDAKTGALLASLEGHSHDVHSAVFSPDGQRIVTASGDETAKIWDAKTGALLASLEGHSNSVRSAAFSPDGQRIVTASGDNTAKIWDAKTGALLASLEGHSDDVYSAVFSPDGQRIVTGSKDNTAKIWDAKTGALLASLEGHSSREHSAVFSPDGQRIVTASGDNTAKIWDAKTGALLASLEGHSSGVNSAVFSPDGQRMVTASDDRTAKIWDAKTGALLAILEGHLSWLNSAVFSPDGQRIVTATYDNTAKIWDAKTGALLASLEGHSDDVYSAVFSPDGQRIVTGSKDNTAKIWDAKTGALLASLEGHSYWVISVEFSPDCQRIVTASGDNTAKIWDAKTGALLAILEDDSDEVNSAVFSPDGQRIVTATKDNTAKIWDAKTGVLLASLGRIIGGARIEGQRRGVLSAVFSPDGQRIVTGSMDRTAKIWDAKTGALLDSLEGHSHDVHSAVFSPDGQRIVTASGDETAKIWDAKTGALLASLEGHSNSVRSAAFSPDGQRIVTASGDNTTKIWDAKTGKLKYTFLAVDETDYLVYDEHYRYDGTEAARKLLYLVCGTEVIELDQVKDQLWVPNLAERIMKGEEINAPKLSDLDLCDLIPKVEEQESPRGEYRFKIIPRRGGLGQTVVFVNGIEVKRLEVKDLVKQGNDYLLKLKQTDVEAFFVAGQQNKVSVRAFTAKNDIGSRGATVEVETTQKTVEPPSLHAVVMGVSDYKGDALDLKFAAKDARDFGNALVASASKLFNYDGVNRINLYSIHTESDRSHFPDKGSLKKVFESIGKQAKPNDVLLIFFAGHGVMNPTDQQFYFLTADASAMVNPEAGGISTRELFEWIQPTNIKAMKRVLILDACNSGQAIKDIVKLGDQPQEYLAARNDEQGKFIKAIDKLNERSGLFILSASASDENAYEMGRYNQGVLTYSLLKSIKEDPTIVDNQNFLDVSKWFDASEKTVEEITKMTGARQQPQIVRTTNFNIGLVDDEVRSKIILPLEKPMFSNCNFQDEDLMMDNLELNKQIDAQLSDMAARSVDSPITFYPGSTSEEAYQLSGRYSITGNEIAVRALLRQRSEVKARFEVKGRRDQLEELVKQVVTAALEKVN